MQKAIVVDRLTKVYSRRGKGKINAVDKINMEIKKGELFGFLGPNGAGKTTTIKLICGLIYPTKGNIFVNGYNVLSQTSKVKGCLGAVLEGNRNIHWRLTVKENLNYFGNLRFVHGKVLGKRIDSLIDFFDLKEVKNELVMKFSRGMQQKVAIAAALISDPPILLLDEPTLGLDVKSSRLVKERVGELVEERGKTVILTTHRLEVAQEVCHRVAIINKGKIILQKRVEDLIKVFSTSEYKFILGKKLNSYQRKKLLRLTPFKIEEDEEKEIIKVPIKDEDLIYQVIDILKEVKIPIISMGIEKPTLEDIFVRVTEGGKDAK